ncbi:LOW QUALITY PROTEIN: hypothetical protein Cgig2_018000 [Carnegiea gigantea]|uniref:Uncharacterized protein n=1 Tax=Carnegiea gigantea TaxID=171969 RepID=A0A9Q1JGD5_9CARY|nr:LOW QUALITY PROTEIN: hypothetical protein Cgig2_018000 [Carnegiea gigantea]
MKTPKHALKAPNIEAKDQQAENKKEQEVNKDPYASNVEILIIIAVLMCRALIAFIIRGRSLRHGLIIAWTIVVSSGQIETHQLKVPTLGSSLTTILNVLDIRLEVPLLAESIRDQGHQEFPKEFSTVLMSSLVALMLSLGCFLSSCRALGLYSGVGLFPLLASKASFSFLTFFQRRLYLAIKSGQGSASPGPRSTNLNLQPLTSGQRPRLAKERKNNKEKRSKEGFGLTLAMARLLGDLDWLRRATGGKDPRLSHAFHQSILGKEIICQEIHSLGLDVHQGLSNSPRSDLLALSRAAPSWRSQCLMGGRGLPKPSMWG